MLSLAGTPTLSLAGLRSVPGVGRLLAGLARLMDASGPSHLAARVRRGEPEAADELAERLECVPAFVRACSRRRGGGLDAAELDDVVQNVLVAVWSKLDRFDERRSFEGWVWGFCEREVRAGVRRARSRPTVELEEAAGDPATGAAPARVSDESEAVVRAVEELGPPGSEIVRLKHFEDATFPDIADALDLPLGSVKTHYYRAVGRLRVRLASLWRALS